MKGSRRRWVIAGLVTAVALVAGTLAFSPLVSAQTSGDDGERNGWFRPPWADGGPPWARGGWGHGPWGHRGWLDDDERAERGRQARTRFSAAVAEELDVPADRVETALRGIVSGYLDERVAAGDLERAEADEALAAYDDGNLKLLFAAVFDQPGAEAR